MTVFYDFLPGLWLLLLAGILDRALRRFFEPVPARVWGAFAFVLLVLFGRVLFLGETLLPVGEIMRFAPYQEMGLEPVTENRLQRDLTHAIVPWQAEVRRHLRSGEWPLWNPHSSAGQPLLANPQAMPFHPLVMLTLPLALSQAAGGLAALRVLVALVFTFLLLRRQGISEWPATAGALAYGLCGFMMLFLGWPHGNSTATLPVLLYATASWAGERRRRDLFLLTLAIFSTFAAGHPETALYVLVCGGCFALARIRAAATGQRWKIFRGWAVAAILAGLLATPFILSAASYLSKTNRYHTLVERNAEWTRYPFLLGLWRANLLSTGERLVPIAAPNAWGNNRFGAYWGHHNINEAAGGFAGTLTLFAALLALFPLSRSSPPGRRFPQEIFMIGAVAVCLVVIFQPPGLIELLIRLPVVDKSPTIHRRLLMLLAFATAYLAACTWERWRLEGLPRKRVAAVAGSLGLLVLWGYLAHPHPEDPALLAGLRHLSLAVQLVCLGIGTALFLRPRGEPRRTRLAGLRLAGLGIVGLVAAELLFFHAPVNAPAPRSHFYPRSPPMAFLQSELIGRPEGYRMLGLYGALPPEFATVYGLADPRSLGPSQAQRVNQLTEPLRREPEAFLFNKADHPLLDLLGVRYVLAPPGKSVPRTLEVAFEDPNGTVWRRPGALPRLFLPRSVEIFDGGSWSEWTAENADFRARTLAAAMPGHAEDWRARSRSRLELEGLAATHAKARADLGEERFMASSLYQDGGWRLLVDGAPWPITLANGPLLGAWLPAGQHRLDLVYRPPGFLPGVALAGLAAAGLLALVFPPPRGHRVRKSGAQTRPV